MNKKSSIILLISCFLSLINVFAQKKIIDSLRFQNFDALALAYKNSKEHKVKAKLYATAYLEKAKNVNDTLNIIKGYQFLLETYSHSRKAVRYADSIILIAKSSIYEKQLAKGYLLKGIQLYYQSKYSKSLDSYVTAKKYF